MPSYTAQSFIDEAEENFNFHNFEDAFRLAIMAKQLNPQFDGIDQFIAAYEVHVAAVQKQSRNIIDLYAVLGIVDALANTETIKKSYKKLALMVHPDKNTSAAAEGAFKLISEAWKVLSQPSARKAYDLQWGPRPSSCPRKGTPSSSDGGATSSGTYGGRACPTCNQWCNYENKNRTSINCSSCCRKYVFRSSSARSVPPCSSSGAEDSSGASASHYSNDPGFSTVTPTVCPFCNTHCVYHCAERVSITCPNCKFGFSALSKQGCRVSFGNSGRFSFSFKRSC